MANSHPKKKYKLFKIFFVVFFLSAVYVAFLGVSVDQKRKPAALTANVIAFWNGRAALETKVSISALLSGTRTSHPYKNVFMPDENKKVRLSLKSCKIDYSRIYADIPGRSASPSPLNINESNDNPGCIRTEGRLQKDAIFRFSRPMRG